MIWLYDFPPPARYDHPFVGVGSVIELPLQEVQQLCPTMGAVSLRGTIYACSWGQPWRKGWPCTIVLPELSNTITKADQAALRRVENANCNGWPKGHRE